MATIKKEEIKGLTVRRFYKGTYEASAAGRKFSIDRVPVADWIVAELHESGRVEPLEDFGTLAQAKEWIERLTGIEQGKS